MSIYRSTFLMPSRLTGTSSKEVTAAVSSSLYLCTLSPFHFLPAHSLSLQRSTILIYFNGGLSFTPSSLKPAFIHSFHEVILLHSRHTPTPSQCTITLHPFNCSTINSLCCSTNIKLLIDISSLLFYPTVTHHKQPY